MALKRRLPVILKTPSEILSQLFLSKMSHTFHFPLSSLLRSQNLHHISNTLIDIITLTKSIKIGKIENLIKTIKIAKKIKLIKSTKIKRKTNLTKIEKSAKLTKSTSTAGTQSIDTNAAVAAANIIVTTTALATNPPDTTTKHLFLSQILTQT